MPKCRIAHSKFTKTGKIPKKQEQSKNIMISAYNAEGVLTTHRVPDGTTVNKEYYDSYLRKILHPAICCKCPELLRVTPLIIHDNATLHKAAIVKAIFKEYHCEVLKHMSYSPDLSPPDYDLKEIEGTTSRNRL